MTDEKRYEVVFEGGLVDGADPGAVRDNVARLFKMDAGRLDKLFSGKRYIIKRNLDKETALKYQLAMRKAGAVCRILALEGGADYGARSGGFAIAPVGVIMDESAPTAAPSIDTAALDMLEPGADLGEAGSGRSEVSAPRPLDADIAPPGVTLVESPAIEAPEIPVQGLSLAEPGVDLAETAVPGPAAVPDTSRYTLAPQEEEEGAAASYLKSLGLD